MDEGEQQTNRVTTPEVAAGEYMLYGSTVDQTGTSIIRTGDRCS